MSVQNNEYLTIINNREYIFIPRDAGFFSVFNFIIGTISKGIKAYPLFNKDRFFQFHQHRPQHFCYWTQNNNSWMDFFEPIKYYPTDNTHINILDYNFIATDGSDIPDTVFTHPSETANLIKDTVKFNQWRNSVHTIYQQYIKFDTKLISESNTIMSDIKHINNIIGVHYRHPSHSIESGDIYLQQYFDIIDSIILAKPHSSIFIASDTDFGILAFKDKYKDKIYYVQNTKRLNLDNILSWAYAIKSQQHINDVGFINNKGYELHHTISESDSIDNYQTTKDLLIEILCLSQCHHLVHTISNIALALSYMNPKLILHPLL